jgi:hypothetical protein
MYSPWGLTVDKSHSFPAVPGDYSVDSMTLIVRNPDGGYREWGHVDSVCGTGRGCSGSYLLDRQGVIPIVHNPEVLTGTTGILYLFEYRR